MDVRIRHGQAKDVLAVPDAEPGTLELSPVHC